MQLHGKRTQEPRNPQGSRLTGNRYLGMHFNRRRHRRHGIVDTRKEQPELRVSIWHQVRLGYPIDDLKVLTTPNAA